LERAERLNAYTVLAQTSGRIKLNVLSKPVEVLRDKWGIPHIYAQTMNDLFFAQGFVAAQDRLWQMEMWRRVGEGRLAEILGSSAIERDKFARLIRYRGDMDVEWKSYAPDARTITESFVSGINAFIDKNLDQLPSEFQLTGIQPEPWTPETCITRMAGFIMTRNANNEVVRAKLISLLGKEKVSDLLEIDLFHDLTSVHGLAFDGIDNSFLNMANAANAPISFQLNEGSNNWVVGGALTSSGMPIIANDPHRQLTVPSLYYMVHLICPGWNVIGAGEPALPGVAIGHNEQIGFGYTVARLDQQDIYIEEINPENSRQYYYQGKWEDMECAWETIRVKGLVEPVEIELHFTRHGPIIHEDTEGHRAYVLRWVGSEPGAAGYLASLSINRATNWQEFLSALERWKVPSENFVYADVCGNIGWHVTGLVPIRTGWSGLLPVSGSSGNYEWNEFLSFANLPQSYNPPSEFIATANNNIIPEGYKHGIGFEWAQPFRIQRIDEVLRSRKGWTVEDFKRLQCDELSLPARELIPLLKSVKVNDASICRAIELLLEWDMILSHDSTAAALYELWVTRLISNVFRPLVQDDVWLLLRSHLPLTRLIKCLKELDGSVPELNDEKRRDQILIKSLEEAIYYLHDRLGDDISKWQWGNLHVAEFKHSLSTNELKELYYNLPAVARGGDAYCVNATSGENLLQTHGASFRQILDLSEWDNSVVINVPGQSGQPGSPHYSDLLPFWATGKYIPLLFSKEKIERNASQRLILEPTFI
jgi:penicillin amidase